MLFTAVAVQRNAACKLCGVALDEKVLDMDIGDQYGYGHAGWLQRKFFQ